MKPRKLGKGGMFAIKPASIMERKLEIIKGGDIYGHGNNSKSY